MFVISLFQNLEKQCLSLMFTTKTNNRRCLFKPLFNSTVEQAEANFLTDHVPATVQNLLQMINLLVLNRLTIYHMPNSTPN